MKSTRASDFAARGIRLDDRRDRDRLNLVVLDLRQLLPAAIAGFSAVGIRLNRSTRGPSAVRPRG